VLLVDSEGKIGIVKRTKKVAISSGTYGMACAGTVNEKDFLEDDPFLACALRETLEECNMELKEIHFDGIVVPKQKMQPIFLYHVKLEDTWENLYPQMKQAQDYAFETESLYAVPLEHSIQFAAQARMTDTAAYQIWRYAKSKGYTRHWYLDMSRPLKKRKIFMSGGG
jgi:8-oxo-dGTP pyrophosphatase MutT (NUDIX family)